MASKNTTYIIIGILLVAAIFILPRLGLFAATSSSTVTQSAPAQVNPSSSFTLTYNVGQVSGKWGGIIHDSVTGGCTFPDGTNTYSNILSSLSGTTSTVTVTAPASGTCSFTGTYQFGSDINPTPFQLISVTVGENTCPTGQVKCSDGTCKTSCPAQPICGDGACNGGETTTSCPSDCKETNWLLYVGIGVGVLVLFLVFKKK